MQPCQQEDRLKRIEKLLDGNGQPGVIQTLARLNVTVTENNTVNTELRTAVSAFTKYMAAKEAIDKEREKRKNGLMTIIGILAGVLGSMIAILFK